MAGLVEDLRPKSPAGRQSSDTPAPPAAAPEEEEHPARAGKPGVTSNSAVIGYAAFERMMTGNPRPSTGCAIIVNRNTARPEDTAIVENAQDQGKATKAEDPEDQEQIKTQSMDAAPKTDDEGQSMEAAYEEARSAYRTIKLQVEKMDTLMKCQEDLALGHPKAQDRKGGEARDSSSPLRDGDEEEAQDSSSSMNPLCHTPLHTPTPSHPPHTPLLVRSGVKGSGAVLGRATTDITSSVACPDCDDRSDQILPRYRHSIPLNKRSDKILHAPNPTRDSGGTRPKQDCLRSLQVVPDTSKTQDLIQIPEEAKTLLNDPAPPQ